LERDLSAYLHVPNGALRNADLGKLYPFQNTFDVIKIPGSDLRELLLKGARCFQKIEPQSNAPHWLMNADIAPYEAFSISGLSYQIDLTKGVDDPERIKGLQHNGRTVLDADPFYLASNSYRLGHSLGAQKARALSCLTADQRGHFVRDVIEAIAPRRMCVASQHRPRTPNTKVFASSTTDLAGDLCDRLCLSACQISVERGPMKLIKNLIILGVLVGGAGYLSKPSAADVDAKIAQTITSEIIDGKVDASNDPAVALLLLTCKGNVTTCTQIVQSGIKTTVEDRVVYTAVNVEGFGHRASCYGAFTKFVCPGGLQK